MQTNNERPSQPTSFPAPSDMSLPPIRTMADDLAEAKGAPSPIPVAFPTASSSPSRPAATQSTGRNIALPATGAPRRSWRTPVFLVLGIAVLAAAAVVGFQFIPRTTGTIADAVPANALATVSFQRGFTPLETAMLPSMTQSLGITPTALGESWSELAYVLVPGASPSDPVPLLVLRGSSADLTTIGSPSLSARPVSDTDVLLVRQEDAGRLGSLVPLGRDRSFRRLFRDHPSTSKGWVYLQDGQLTTLLQPFVVTPSAALPGAVFFSLDAGATADQFALVGAHTGTVNGSVKDASWDALLRAIPASVLTSSARESLGQDLDAWRVNESTTPAFQNVLRVLTGTGPVLDDLRGAVQGLYILGTLPTDHAGVRDGFALIPLTPDSRDRVVRAMRRVEPALQALDVFLTGQAFPGAAFTDASYRDIPIRYANFGSPERSVDYVVTDSLLFLSSSRESMHLLLDTLSTPTLSLLTQNPAVQETLSDIDGSLWYLLTADPAVSRELPSRWRPFLEGLRALVLVRDTATTVHGAASVRAPLQNAIAPPPPQSPDIAVPPAPSPLP